MSACRLKLRSVGLVGTAARIADAQVCVVWGLGLVLLVLSQDHATQKRLAKSYGHFKC